MTCPGGEASAQKAPGAAPTHRGQCRNGFLDLGQDHVPVDVSGCTLVQCLAPRAPEKRRHWSGARPAPPRPVTAGGPVGPSAALAPGPQPTCSHMPPRQGPRRPPPAGPHGHSPPASSWWRAPSTGSVTARGTGSPAGSGRVAGCGGAGPVSRPRGPGLARPLAAAGGVPGMPAGAWGCTCVLASAPRRKESLPNRNRAQQRNPGRQAPRTSRGERGASGCRPLAPGSSVATDRGPGPCGGGQPGCRRDMRQRPPGAGTPSGRTRACPRATLQSSPDLGVRSEEAVAGHSGVWPHAAVLQQGHQSCGREQRPRSRMPSPGAGGGGGAGGTLTSREHGERLLEQGGRLSPRVGELLLGQVRLLAQQEVCQGHGEGEVRELGQVPMSLRGAKTRHKFTELGVTVTSSPVGGPLRVGQTGPSSPLVHGARPETPSGCLTPRTGPGPVQPRAPPAWAWDQEATGGSNGLRRRLR